MKHVRRTWIWMVKHYLDLHFEGLTLHVQQEERCMENSNTETQRGNAKALLTEKEIRSWWPRRPAVIAGAQVLLLILHNLPCCAQEPWQGWAGIATMPLFAPVRGMLYYLFNNLTFFFLTSFLSTFNISHVPQGHWEAHQFDNFKCLLFKV